MSKSILGIQIALPSGCAVYYDGRIVYAASEERFTKVKNEVVFPKLAIKSAYEFLKKNNYPLPEIAAIPSEKSNFRIYLLRRECTFSIGDYVREQHDYYYERFYKNNNIEYENVFPEKYNRELLTKDQVERLHGTSDPLKEWVAVRRELTAAATGIENIYFINHELSHAAYALYASPISKEDALVMAIDGFGDDANCSIWTYEKGRLVCHKKYSNFNLGRLYRYVTLILGMKPSEDEHKVMGLAPYANDRMTDEVFAVFENAWYVDKSDGGVKYRELPTDMYFYFRSKLEGKRFDAIAGALQKYTEKMVLDMAGYWATKLKKRKVVLAGGVALNIKANMHLGEMDSIDEIFVPASGSDESQSIGAIFGYLDQANEGCKIEPIPNFYLGNEHDQADIERKIRKFVAENKGFEFKEKITNNELARLLADGFIIGRFAGRMEFGARALGNRSILANPSTKNIVQKLNSQIKHRDFWMPFAPSIIDYKADEYLVNPKKLKFPFMTVGCRTKESARDKIFGALHPADFTARPQIVTKDMNGSYWDLINEFCKITGIGALLNTSLNLHGLPICESAEDLFNVLLNSDLDMAVLGTALVYRSKDKNRLPG